MAWCLVKHRDNFTFTLRNLRREQSPWPQSMQYTFALYLHAASEELEYDVTKSLELELQMVPLSATRYSCIAILWVSLASFATIILCVASQRVFIVVSEYFFIDSVRKRLDTTSYCEEALSACTVTPLIPMAWPKRAELTQSGSFSLYFCF
jgi:hypothetical protein